MDLQTLTPEQISQYVNDADKPKRGFISPAIQKVVDSKQMSENMSDKIDWPKNDKGEDKTVAQQVTALNQNIENHKTKVLKGKATAWPNLLAVAVTLDGSTEPCALLVNQDLLAAAKSAKK